MDYYLKAESEAAMWSALTAVGAAVQVQVKDEDGNVVETRHSAVPGFSIDMIGTIYKPTGNFIRKEENGATIDFPEMSPVSGFHANLRGPAGLALGAVLIDPAPQTPSRVWF